MARARSDPSTAVWINIWLPLPEADMENPNMAREANPIINISVLANANTNTALPKNPTKNIVVVP